MNAPAFVHDFLELGANITAKTFTGATPLHVAAAHGSTRAAAILASAVPKTELRRGDGRWRSAWLDRMGQSPEDVALVGAAANVNLCVAMLKVLQPSNLSSASPSARQESVRLRKSRCAEAIRERRAHNSARSMAELPLEDASWDEAASRCPARSDDSSDKFFASFASADESHSMRDVHATVSAGASSSCDLKILDASEVTSFSLARDVTSIGAPVLIRGDDRHTLSCLSTGKPILTRSSLCAGGGVPDEWRVPWAREALISRLGHITVPCVPTLATCPQHHTVVTWRCCSRVGVLVVLSIIPMPRLLLR